jgi:hypothetical protein
LGSGRPGLSAYAIRDLARWYEDEGNRRRVGLQLDQNADIDSTGNGLRTFELGRYSGDQGQGDYQCAEGSSYPACSRHVVYFAPVLPLLDLTHQ